MPEKLYDYLKLEDTTDLTGLTFLEKVRAIYNSWFTNAGYSEARNAKNQEDITKAELTLQADLLMFIHKATQPIRDGLRHSVKLDIDSTFAPVLDSVLESQTVSRYYKSNILSRPMPDIDIKYKIRISLEAK